jgi:hypothetical protein
VLPGNQSELAFANDVGLEARRRRCCWRSRVGLERAAQKRATLEFFVLYPGWCFEKVVMGESDGLVWLLTVTFEGTEFPRILGGII